MLMRPEPGSTFNKWTILSLEGEKCLAKCECGIQKITFWQNIVSGKSTQCHKCGILSSAILRAKHGLSKSKEMGVWNTMIMRCHNPGAKSYSSYGGRGIAVCDRWRFGEDGKKAFQCFIEDMGLRPSSKHSIDRINNDLGYSPSNCRWATIKEQSYNKRNSRLFTFSGRSLPLLEWATAFGVRRTTLSSRIYNYKWPIEKAFTEPVKGRPLILN